MPARKSQISRILREVNKIKYLPQDSKILEIGSAQGLSLMILNDLGFDCYGIEPSEHARKVSEEVQKFFNRNLMIRDNYAEDIRFDNEMFDLLIADSVIEHVIDVEEVFSETFRVLKKGGIFYFSTASSLCPYQSEIRFFPFFGWYPNFLKIKIMKWAVKNRPSIVGFTDTPAINWFTPWKAKRLLKKAGYSEVYDRWDIMNETELSSIKKRLLRIIRSNRIFKIAGDICFPGCNYIAIKDY